MVIWLDNNNNNMIIKAFMQLKTNDLLKLLGMRAKKTLVSVGSVAWNFVCKMIQNYIINDIIYLQWIFALSK